MPLGKASTEADTIAQGISIYKSYDELPLVSTGCDSYASWHPAFKELSPTLTIDEIVDRIIDALPYKKWLDEHLVITGGEPLLGWQKSYIDLLRHPKMSELREITFETNGTQALSKDFMNYLETEWYGDDNVISGREITFSVSPKLSNSGEARKDAIKPAVIAEYQQWGWTYLKFVIANYDDAEEAIQVANYYREAGFDGPVYFMPVGGVESVYALNNRTVAELAMSKGVRYSDRLQVPLFKNEWGT
jgi:organic radical activating enzyme